MFGADNRRQYKKKEQFMLAMILVATSAAIILILGSAHLLYTFVGPKLLPIDADLQFAMKSNSPVITTETTMWKAWIGFNASHSMGAILFGLVYGYLSLFHTELLFASEYLMIVGAAMLTGLLILAKLYWFRAPFIGIAVSLICFIGGIVATTF